MCAAWAGAARLSESKEAVERRTDEAFARSAWADPRAAYRSLLRRLREHDAALFERALGEYEALVVSRLEDPAADPVTCWLDYGRRLADLAAAGRCVRVDAEGRSAADDGSTTEPALLLQLPADESAAAIVIAQPREASAAQRATVALLSDRQQALPA